MVYPFRQIILPTALEQPISKTHQFWEEFGSMEKFSRDSNISLPFAYVNETHEFFLCPTLVRYQKATYSIKELFKYNRRAIFENSYYQIIYRTQSKDLNAKRSCALSIVPTLGIASINFRKIKTGSIANSPNFHCIQRLKLIIIYCRRALVNYGHSRELDVKTNRVFQTRLLCSSNLKIEFNFKITDAKYE